MAGFNVGSMPRPASGQNFSLPEATTSDSAHTTLQGYSTHLKANGGVKAGVLRLKDGAAGDTRIYRDRAFHLRFRSGNQDVRDAGQMTRALFSKAYEGKLSSGAHEKLMEGLDRYLEARGGQLGTRSFEKFFQAFEAAVSREQRAADMANRFAAGSEIDSSFKLSDEALAQLQGKDSAASLSDIAVSSPQSRRAADSDALNLSAFENQSFGAPLNTKSPEFIGRVQQGAAAAFGLPEAQVAQIGGGKGAHSNPFSLSELKGKTVLVVPRDRKIEVNTASFGTGEIAAAIALGPTTRVAKPTEFVLTAELPLQAQLSHRSSDSKRVEVEGHYLQGYRVPADQVRAFIGSMLQPASPGETAPASKLYMTAVRMPAGAETTLKDATQHGDNPAPLQPREWSQFAAGFFLALNEMGDAKLVHHDIKPDNITFDRTTGQVMLIDLGGSVRLDGGSKQTTSITDKNELTRPPNVVTSTRPDGVQEATAHGLEYDRYGFAVMLMTSMAPSVSSLTGEVLRQVFAKPVPEGSDRVGQLLAALKSADQALSGVALNEDARPRELASVQQFGQQLDDAFERDPGARQLVEQALAAGLTQGAASDLAWKTLGESINERAIQLAHPLAGSDAAALKKLYPAQANPDGLAQAMPEAGDPTGKERGAFLGGGSEKDPYE